ncbi:MAG: hypothetical protein INH37_14805 [Myxococcaceae bacterium]|nr:hypothetical protein [Myxococcaceae bacterium]
MGKQVKQAADSAAEQIAKATAEQKAEIDAAREANPMEVPKGAVVMASGAVRVDH